MDRSRRYKRSECSDELGFMADFLKAISGHFYRNHGGSTQQFLHLFGLCCEETNLHEVEIVRVTDEKTIRAIIYSHWEYDKIEKVIDEILGDKVYDWSLVNIKKCDYPNSFMFNYGYGHTEKVYISVR